MFKPIQIDDWISCRKHGFMIEEPFLVLKTIYDDIIPPGARGRALLKTKKKKASGHIFLIRAYIFTFLLVKSQKNV